MKDPKRSDESKEPKDAGEPNAAKKGGFGAFADRYRARWAENHPEMTRTWPAEAAPRSSGGAAETAGAQPVAAGEPNAGDEAERGADARARPDRPPEPG